MDLNRDNLEEIINDCHNKQEQEAKEQLTVIEGKIDDLEEKLESLEFNMSPLLDLLNTLIKTNISADTLEEAPKEIDKKPELAYWVDSGYENIYIHGTKTFDNKDLIKSTFKSPSWSKEKYAWTFSVILNPDYEDKLNKIFPNIVKE